MNLTLDDFRNILGKVNDGDVVFKMRNGQKTGIEKANYGWLLKRNVQNIPLEDNAEIRRLFADAISNALGPYGPSISEETLRSIKTRLGIVEGAGPQPNTLTRPLDRREIKAILDIVDGSGEQMKVDDEVLVKMDAGVDMELRANFERAVNASPILSGKDSLKSVIGKAFRGFPRSQIAACVKDNLALFKAMTLDEMTWHYESTGERMTVVDAFKAALGKVMANNAENMPTLTRTSLLFAAASAPAQFDDNEHNAEDFFRNHKLMQDDDLAALLTADQEEGTDAFSRLVLSRAFDHVRNAFRRDFQECIAANGNVAQQAQESYDARTLGMRREIAEFANDVRNIASQGKANLANFRRDLARELAFAFRGIDLSKIDERDFRGSPTLCLPTTTRPSSGNPARRATGLQLGSQSSGISR